MFVICMGVPEMDAFWNGLTEKIHTQTASKREQQLYQTPSAGRIFWVYGPGQSEITVIGLEPHPNDKRNVYNRITLSSMGETIE